MQETEHPTLELQKAHWKHWNFRPAHLAAVASSTPQAVEGHCKDPNLKSPEPCKCILDPTRRGDKILAYLHTLRLERPSILDMGCGMGWFADKLSQFGPTTGIDLCEEAIAHAKSRFPQVTFLAGNLYEMDLPREHFDVVVSQEVIAHVPDQCDYLHRAAQVLKPRGHLIVTTPNLFVHQRNYWRPIPPGHIEQWLSKRALKRLLQTHFRVLHTTTAVPMGHGGILRVVNSTKLNRIMEWLWSSKSIEEFKEWAGFGWTQIALAQKKS